MLAGFDPSRPVPTWSSRGKRSDRKISPAELDRARERVASVERRRKP